MFGEDLMSRNDQSSIDRSFYALQSPFQPRIQRVFTYNIIKMEPPGLQNLIRWGRVCLRLRKLLDVRT